MIKSSFSSYFRRLSIIELVVSISIVSIFSSLLVFSYQKFAGRILFNNSFGSFVDRFNIATIISIQSGDSIPIRIYKSGSSFFVSLELNNMNKKYAQLISRDLELVAVKNIIIEKEEVEKYLNEEFILSVPSSFYDMGHMKIKFIGENIEKIFSV